MQRPVKDYPQKLLPDRNPQGFGVVTDPVDTDINLAFDAQGIRLIAQLKGDDIGIIVVLQEILVWENYFTDRDPDWHDQIRSTLARIGNAVPQPIELGYHMCYGSPKDQHLVQPKDTATMVDGTPPMR